MNHRSVGVIRYIKCFNPLGKQACSNILKILPAKKMKKKKKKKKKSDKNSDIFHISALNIDYGYSLEPPRQSGSNEYPQFMFFSRKKNSINVVFLISCNIQFY